MSQEPYLLDEVRRIAVLEGMKEVCHRRGWTLLAAHVRTNHVHAVLEADRPPDQVMGALKAYASRVLNRLRLDGKDRRRWAHHGSTRYLWTKEETAAAIRYVVEGQGTPMAVFVHDT
jgi:REP element-mobilizing transposase RayT